MEEEIYLDFTYIDQYLDLVKSKIKTHGTISMFNGIDNKVIFIEKNTETDWDLHVITTNGIQVIIDYEDLVADFMNMYKNSLYGKMSAIYRIYVGSEHPKTKGEFRELWGDVFYINQEFKLTKENITAEQLSNIVINLELTEEEVKIFGKPEEYIFKDEENNVVLGMDLI